MRRKTSSSDIGTNLYCGFLGPIVLCYGAGRCVHEYPEVEINDSIPTIYVYNRYRLLLGTSLTTSASSKHELEML